MKKRGVGLSLICYPSGMSGGGDPSEAIVRVKPDGSVDLIVGSVDIGQGCRTVLAQMAAEVLGVPYERVNVYNGDTHTCPLSTGTFASRVTYVDGNAVVRAATAVRDILFEIAAEDLGASPADLVARDGAITVDGAPEKAVPIGQLAAKAHWGLQKPLVASASFMRPASRPHPETGAIDPFYTLAYAATMAEVEVDTETGEVTVLRLTSAYDVGKAINPLHVEGQIHGGAMMGLGTALMEQLHPYYPSLEWQPETLADYVIPTTMDTPELQAIIVEKASTEGPFGAKGIGEMTANSPTPAIVNAIHDAIGVWIDEPPVTPEKVLAALQSSAAAKAP